MPTATSIKLESPYKNKPFSLISNVLLALIMGPFIIYMMVDTAVTNKVDDPTSWILLCIASLLFSYLSYSKFKYIYFVFYGKQSAEINYQNKSILFLPYKETVWLDKVDTFIYSTKSKKYILRDKKSPGSSFEIKRNAEFEQAMLRFSLECKVE